MAIAVESTTINSFNQSSSIEFTKPAGTSENDVLVATFINADDQNNVADGTANSSPTGWTLVKESSLNDVGVHMFYKVATSSEPSSYTWTLDDNSDDIAGVMFRLSDVDPTDPLDQSNLDADAFSYNNIAPSITPTSANSFMIFMAAASDGTADSFSLTADDPTWTEYFNSSSTTIGPDGTVIAGAVRPETSTATISATGTSTESGIGILANFNKNPNASVNSSVQVVASSVGTVTVSGNSNFTDTVQILTAVLDAPTISTQTVVWNNESRPVASTWIIEEQI